MGQVNTYIWPAASETLIANAITTGAAGFLSINTTASTGIFSFGGNVRRKISLKSAGVANVFAFDIIGMIDGTVATETLTGPGIGATVESAKSYDSITSIYANAAVTALSIGSGHAGFTSWFQHNYNSAFPALTVQIDGTANITYSFETTLEQPVAGDVNFVFRGIVVPNPDSVNAFTTKMLGDTGAEIAFYNYASRFSRIAIDASTTGSLVAYFLQQGTL